VFLAVVAGMEKRVRLKIAKQTLVRENLVRFAGFVPGAK
jgi:hypothetical protein